MASQTKRTEYPKGTLTYVCFCHQWHFVHKKHNAASDVRVNETDIA